MKKLFVSMYVFLTTLASGSGLYKHAWIKKVNKFILRKIKGRQVNVNGYTLTLDRNDSLNLSIYKVFEPFETEFFKRNIKTGDRVLDIGANIGYYTLLFSKLVGSEGKVYAFEPDKENFTTLTNNIKRNNALNVTPIGSAVATTTGVLKLYHSNDKGDQRIYDPGDGRKHYEVPCVSLDQYFRDSSLRFNWVKMDIQGAEGYAFEGMRTLIEENPDISIVCEFWPFGLERSGYGVDKFFRLLSETGLQCWELNEHDKKIIRVSKDSLNKHYSVESKKFGNLILKHTASSENFL